jgi:hypothetical protein
LTVAATFLFGMIPAWQAGGVNAAEALKRRGRGASSGRGTRRLRRAMITAEVALSVVLLVGAGLMIRSIAVLSRVDPGYRTSNLAVLNLHQTGERYGSPAALDAFTDRVLTRLRAESRCTLDPRSSAAIGRARPLQPWSTRSSCSATIRAATCSASASR